MPHICPQKSKLYVKFLTKHNVENYKWFSRLKDNKLPNEQNIAGIKERVKKAPFYAFINVIQVYDNLTGELIESTRP